jgi:hypothetical protein
MMACWLEEREESFWNGSIMVWFNCKSAMAVGLGCLKDLPQYLNDKHVRKRGWTSCFDLIKPKTMETLRYDWIPSEPGASPFGWACFQFIA